MRSTFLVSVTFSMLFSACGDQISFSRPELAFDVASVGFKITAIRTAGRDLENGLLIFSTLDPADACADFIPIEMKGREETRLEIDFQREPSISVGMNRVPSVRLSSSDGGELLDSGVFSAALKHSAGVFAIDELTTDSLRARFEVSACAIPQRRQNDECPSDSIVTITGTISADRCEATPT